MLTRPLLKPAKFAPREAVPANGEPAALPSNGNGAPRRAPEKARPASRADSAATLPQVRVASFGAPPRAPERSINRNQYLRAVEEFSRKSSRKAVREATLDVTSGEIERVAQYAGRLRGRYLAMVLEIGRDDRMVSAEQEMRNLARCREQYEEAGRALAALREAIASGDVLVSGVCAD